MRTTACLVAGALTATTVFAQQTNFVNARVVARSAQPDVVRAIAAITKAQMEPAWIGYAVSVINNESGATTDGASGAAWNNRL